MSPGKAASFRCVNCIPVFIWVSISLCFLRKNRWQHRFSASLHGRTTHSALFAAIRSGLFFACMLPSTEEGSFIRGEFRSTLRFCCKCLNREDAYAAFDTILRGRSRAEIPVLFAKACEAFIIELTYRAWAFTL